MKIFQWYIKCEREREREREQQRLQKIVAKIYPADFELLSWKVKCEDFFGIEDEHGKETWKTKMGEFKELSRV